MNALKIIEVSNLFFSYGKEEVLNNVSFAVEEGELCALLGQNGCGKTTLLKNILGIQKPCSGIISIAGTSIVDYSRRELAKTLSFVPQQCNVPFSYSVLDMLLVGKTPHMGIFSSPSGEHVMEALEILHMLNISHLERKGFNELSGGEKQLVLIGRALLQNSSVMLLDEPTAHLDFKNQFMVMETIRKVVKTKRLTAIITLHDPNLAVRYCNSVIMLKNGNVKFKGNTNHGMSGDNLSNLYNMDINIEHLKNGQSVILPEISNE